MVNKLVNTTFFAETKVKGGLKWFDFAKYLVWFIMVDFVHDSPLWVNPIPGNLLSRLLDSKSKHW